MCARIFKNEILIETPSDFKKVFSVYPIKKEIYTNDFDETYTDEEADECLCAADLEKTFDSLKIEFTKNVENYYVSL